MVQTEAAMLARFVRQEKSHFIELQEFTVIGKNTLRW